MNFLGLSKISWGLDSQIYKTELLKYIKDLQSS